jgi:hypothetical protein
LRGDVTPHLTIIDAQGPEGIAGEVRIVAGEVMKRFHRFDLTDAATFSDMINSDDQVPARVAYAMLQAVRDHILEMEDDDEVDASEGFTPDEIKQALSAVRQLERVFGSVVRRVQR